MGCKYRFNGVEYESYQDLIKGFSNEDLENVLSIVFSLNLDKLDEVYNLIDELKKNYKFKPTKTLIDSSADIDVGDSFTTQTFIDSGYFLINGEAPMYRLNKDEQIEIIKEQLAKTESEDYINNYISNMHNNWDKIAKDASDLHRIIVSGTTSDSRYFSGASLNTSFSAISDLLLDASKLIFKQIYRNNAKARLHKNINLTADLRGLTELIIGHIDYLLVKDNGDIEIFNIKASSESDTEWSAIKLEKFKYQLALLKRILEFNGINAKHIRLNIVPIKINYNEDFSEVTGISVSNNRSYDTKNSQYSFLKYDNVAALFIDSKVTVEELDDSTLDRINNYLQAIFTGRDADIRIDGIKESAKGWIRHNWKFIATESPTGGWEIKLPGSKESIHISNTKVGEDNEELIALVTSKEEQLFKNSAREKTTYRIVSDIKASFRHGYNFFQSSSTGTVNTSINDQLSKYFDSKKEEDKDREYKWELIENDTLTNANLIMFRHKVTNLIDIVDVTPFDVSIENKTRRRNNLLGAYIPDRNNYGFTMKSNYGNIEAIKTLTVLNEIIPNLNFKPKLGQLKVISASLYRDKKGIEYEMGLLLPEFNTVVNVVNKNNSSLKMTNNFKGVNSIDPALLFILTWKEAILDKPDMIDLLNLSSHISLKFNPDGTSIDGLENITSVEGKIDKLNMIIDSLHNIAETLNVSLSVENLQKLEISKDTRVEALAKVYKAALRALNMYYGDILVDNEEFSMISEYLSRPLSIPNSNVRVVAQMFLLSIDKIANTLIDRYAPIKETIMLYYKDCGYTSIENSTIGNLAKLFKNLYALDPITGEKTMNFKNPYNPSESLKEHERKFLKSILYEINKIRYELKGQPWNYTGVNDPKLILKVDAKYLYVPLERASLATRRGNLKKEIIDSAKRLFNRARHPKDTFKEFTEGLITEDEFKKRNSDILNFQAYNPFTLSDNNDNVRNNQLQKGSDYFETNVENIMVDFLEKHILSIEYNKMLTRTKGVILSLYLRGETEGDEKNIEHTIKTINDFLSVSVYNRSIMEESSLFLDSYLEPIRKAVSTCYIAGNIAGSVRDTILGLVENIVRALTKFLTDIGLKDVVFGYKEVITEGPTNVMSITKLNQMNLKWRISNLDVARISEGLKTGRGGLVNAENWMYATMKRPDYINRMVLLIAKMHKDGVYDAYNLNKGKLEYDWKKDKRFSEYAKENTKHPDYHKLRSLYLSLIRLFNLENNTRLVEGDSLPDAYTSSQISKFKNFSDNIYGSYNQSSRWKSEHIAIGRNFMVFSTWLNGIVDVYTKKPLLSKTETEWKLASENGELLYFDLYGNVVPESDSNAVKETPVMTDVPIIVQGCWYTLTDFLKACIDPNEGSLKVDFWTDPILRRNMRRMLTDLLVGFLIATLVKMGIDAMYKDHKKVAKGEEFAKNALIEILYKGSSNCWDGFRGPFSVIEYFGNSTNPATYKLSSKVLNDGMQYLFGDKTTGLLISGMSALPRSFKDSITLWEKEQGWE